MLAYKYTVTNQFSGENILINAALDNDGSCKTVTGQPTGLRLTRYPVFELDIRNEDDEKQGQHGIFDYFSFYGQRNITFEGVIIAGNHEQLIEIENRVKRIFTLPAQPIANVNDGYILIEWEDALGVGWQIKAKIERDLRFSRETGVKTEASFYIDLKASDPFIVTQTEYSQTQLLGWRQSQFIVPAFLPNNFNFQINNLLNIYQGGTADSPWRALLYGPADNPKITRFFENVSDDTLISNFTESTWSGGTEDTDIFQSDSIARKLSSTNGVQDIMTISKSINLDYLKFITFYFYVDYADNLEVGDYLTGQNYIKFKENPGSDEFVLEFSEGNPTIRNGWNYFIILKDEFEKIGTPSWNNISEVEFSVKSKAGTMVNVTFDNLRSRNILFTESKLETAISLAAGEYIEIDILNGNVLKNGVTDVTGSVTLDSDFFTLLPKQNLLAYESDLNPRITWEYPTQPVEFYWRDSIL